MRELKCYTKFTDTAPIHGAERLFSTAMEQRGIAMEYRNVLIEVTPGEFWIPDFYLPAQDAYVAVGAGAKVRRHAAMAQALYTELRIFYFDKAKLTQLINTHQEFPFETREVSDGEIF